MVNRESGFKLSVLLAVLFLLTTFAATAFGMWAYSERADYKGNVDKKVADAVAIAVQKAESAKEADFVKREKSPLRTYLGPATYGSLSFKYPKTWSIYQVDKDAGTVLDIYANPRVVPGVGSNQLYAFRAEIVSNTYEEEVTRLNSFVKSGKVKARAFRPKAVSDVLGIRVEGEISSGVQGVMILIPLRDKTIKLYSESQEYASDFDDIIVPSLKFIP